MCLQFALLCSCSSDNAGSNNHFCRRLKSKAPRIRAPRIHRIFAIKHSGTSSHKHTALYFASVKEGMACRRAQPCPWFSLSKVRLIPRTSINNKLCDLSPITSSYFLLQLHSKRKYELEREKLSELIFH